LQKETTPVESGVEDKNTEDKAAEVQGKIG